MKGGFIVEFGDGKLMMVRKREKIALPDIIPYHVINYLFTSISEYTVV